MDLFTWKIVFGSFLIFIKYQSTLHACWGLSPLNTKNCNIMPKVNRFRLLECCGLPDFFKPDIRKKCASECSSLESHHDPWCCMSKCTMEETELGSNGTVYSKIARNYFRKLFNSTEIMRLVDATLTKCEHEAPDTQTEYCDQPQYGKILGCVHRELFRSCCMVKNEPSCLKIKNFIKKCPAKRDELFDM